MTTRPQGDDDENENGPDHSDRATVVEHVASGLETPPVGLVLLEVLIETDESTGPIEQAALYETFIGRVSTETGPEDSILVTGQDRFTIIRPGLTAPAEAEGFAYRIQAALRPTMLIGNDRVSCQTSIGVAVSRTGDTPEHLIRFAEHALGDARMLGGDMVVAFDDQDRDLLNT